MTPTKKETHRKTAGEIALTIVGVTFIGFGAFLLLTSLVIGNILFALLSVGLIIGGILMIRHSNKQVKQLKKNQQRFGRIFLRKLRASKGTLLLLIILPSIFISLLISDLIDDYYYDPTIEPSVSVTGIIGGWGTAIVWGFVLFYYIPYYAREKPEKYFNKIDPVEATMQYQFSVKLLYVTAAICIFSFSAAVLESIIIKADQLYRSNQLTWLTYVISYSIVFCALGVCSFATLILVIRFALQLRSKDFGFYLSRAYFMISSQNEDSVEKLRYLILALDAYNRFLERSLKLKIKDIMRVYSLIISASAEQKIKIRDSIEKAFEKDKLELTRQLAEISSLPDEEEFLINERTLLNQRLKDILTIIIPAIISIVGFIIAILTQARILEPIK